MAPDDNEVVGSLLQALVATQGEIAVLIIAVIVYAVSTKIFDKSTSLGTQLCKLQHWTNWEQKQHRSSSCCASRASATTGEAPPRLNPSSGSAEDYDTVMRELASQRHAVPQDVLAELLEEVVGRRALAGFLKTVRCVLHEQGLALTSRLAAALLQSYLELHLEKEFDDMLVEVETLRLAGPVIGTIALKAAARVTDLQRGFSRLRIASRSIAGPPCVQDFPLQSLVRLAAERSALPDLLQVLKECKLLTAPCQYNHLLEACIDRGEYMVAEQVMAEAVTTDRVDAVSFNTIIKSRVQSGDVQHAGSALQAMRSAGLQPTVVTFNELIDSTIKKDPNSAWVLLGEMQACDLQPTHVTCSILLKSIQPDSKTQYVQRVFGVLEAMPEDQIDEVLICSALEALIRVDQPDLISQQLKRLRTHKILKKNGCQCYGTIIRSLGYIHDIDGVWETWYEMHSRNILPTSISLGCMVEAVVSNGDPDGGLRLVRQALGNPETRSIANAVVYCSVLKGFSHAKDFGRVWEVYEEMIREGLQHQFSLVTFNTMIDACARCGEMGRAVDLLELMSHQGFEPNVVTYSAILKGYCQENRIDRAFEVLESMKQAARLQPDEHTFNTLLDGCARQGLFDRGIGLLQDMEHSGVRPSNFTLSVLVKLASRAKYMDRAFQLCNELSQKYRIRPNVHVYNGLIQGCVNQRNVPRALGVLERMAQEHVKPDVRTYSLLLRGCLAAGRHQDAAGLLRVSTGLGAGPESLHGYRSEALRVTHGLPTDLLAEVIERIATPPNHNVNLAVQLFREFRAVAPSLRLDQRLSLRLASQAGHRTDALSVKAASRASVSPSD